jgi:hypothetical protein
VEEKNKFALSDPDSERSRKNTRVHLIYVQVLWSLLPEGLFRDSVRDQSLLSGECALRSHRYSTVTLNRLSCEIAEENLAQCKKEATTKSNAHTKKILDFAVLFFDDF